MQLHAGATFKGIQEFYFYSLTKSKRYMQSTTIDLIIWDFYFFIIMGILLV